jgi:hypothetical protein
MVTVLPTSPVVGFKLRIFGGPGVTNLTPLLRVPPTFTTTGPVVAPAGTVATMAEGFQPVTLADSPLNATVPCVEPKSAPVIVTEVPAGPSVGSSPNMDGTFVIV